MFPNDLYRTFGTLAVPFAAMGLLVACLQAAASPVQAERVEETVLEDGAAGLGGDGATAGISVEDDDLPQGGDNAAWEAEEGEPGDEDESVEPAPEQQAGDDSAGPYPEAPMGPDCSGALESGVPMSDGSSCEPMDVLLDAVETNRAAGCGVYVIEADADTGAVVYDVA